MMSLTLPHLTLLMSALEGGYKVVTHRQVLVERINTTIAPGELEDLCNSAMTFMKGYAEGQKGDVGDVLIVSFNYTFDPKTGEAEKCTADPRWCRVPRYRDSSWYPNIC